MSDELLEKVFVSTEIGNPFGAGLRRDQADRFIDYMWDATVLGSLVRQVRLRDNDLEMQKIGVGQRVIRAATEAVDTGENQGAVFSRISLTTKKIRLDWEISTETLEDNIEGAGLEDHLARMFATAIGNDLEDLAINGDTASSDPTLRIFDGWRKVLLNGGNGGNGAPLTEGAAHVVDAGGAVLDRDVFNKALKAMPRKFMQNRPGLRYLTGSGLIQDYLYSITTADATLQGSIGANIVANGAVRTEGAPGFRSNIASFGIPVVEVPYFNETLDGTYSGAGNKDHGDVWMLDPRNLIWGVKRDITIHRQFSQKKDTWEYTVYLRVGLGIENTDAAVVVTNVSAAL